MTEIFHSQTSQPLEGVDVEFGARDDPFAQREGKYLTWRNVQMKVTSKEKGKSDKVILKDVFGQVPAQQTTAIMGPSGSGKTSLLNVLSGRSVTRSKLTVSCDVRLNNCAVNPASLEIRQQIAFVSQDDSLHIASTPRESLRFSAKLRLSKETTDDELDRLTTQMLKELGLCDCADTIVGGALLKGISGGERKRTSVGVELVTKPSMVFLDEPTSGLDSFSALQLCQVLKKMSNAGASVMFTIHQPASDIFESFDHLILLNKGRVMYNGSVQDVPDYFGTRQQPLPPKYNPADWIMIVAQSVPDKDLEKLGFYENDTTDQIEPSTVLEKIVLGKPSQSANHVGVGVQIRLLLKRDFAAMRRDPRVLGFRLFLTSFMSLLTGCIFFKVGNTDPAVNENIQSQFGAEIIVLMVSMFGTALPSLIVFPQERPVFLREFSTNHYTTVAYFMSRLVVEGLLTAIQMFLLALVSYFMMQFQLGFGWHYLIIYSLAMTSTAIAVMIGSGVHDAGSAIEFLPMVFVPQILFAGFFIKPSIIPVWLRWLQYVMPLTYGVKLHVERNFNRNCGSPLGDVNCQKLLSNLNVVASDVWWYWVVMLSLFVVFRCTGLFLLRRKANTFF